MSRQVKILFIVGAILTVTPLGAGLLVTVISMVLAFHDLSQAGITDPHQLAGHIGESLMATVAGVVFSGFGIVMLMVAGFMYAFEKPPQKPD